MLASVAMILDGLGKMLMAIMGEMSSLYDISTFQRPQL